MKNKAQLFVWLLALLIGNVLAQHRGDQLSFQGLDDEVDGGIESMAMGGAFTAMSGSLDNLFHNSAGLTALTRWTVSVKANYYQKEWWENQVYRPNRYFVTLPFYLEGLYVPDPKNNGVLDRDLALDSTYVVRLPDDTGQQVDSKEAADWLHQRSAPVFNNIALAFPLTLFNKKIVVAGSYRQKLNFLDFDRNDTYLLPHIGYSGYEGWIGRVNGGDTLNVNWFRYLRERTGNLKALRAAIATALTERFSVGLSVELTSGTSSDLLQLNKMGYFGLIDENKFFFTYDTLNYSEKGSSDFSSLGIEIGWQYRFDRLTVGMNITLPQTLERKWHYTLTQQTATDVHKSEISGKDQLELPAIYRFGLAFNPVKAFKFSLSYRYAPYSSANFKLARNDTTFRKWVDQHSFMAGLQFALNDVLTLMAGYRWEPAVFVPDGVAYTERGPEKVSLSLGVGFSLGTWGRVVAAGTIQTLKYHDTYFSNTNYVTEQTQKIALGYQFAF